MEPGAGSILEAAHCPAAERKDQDIFMCKYSVIVPVYKVEKELPRCIESILNQTLTDFELILVDDGSPDRSGIICDQYASADPRIRVIHQENGGVSRARNAGLDLAAGQYAVFVDSDDYVENNYLETLDADDSDLVVSFAVVHEADGHIKETVSEPGRIILVETEDEYVQFLKKWYSLQVWGKRFKRSLIGSLRFNEAFRYGEDSIFVAQYLLLIGKVKVCSNVTYHYCLTNAESLTKQAAKGWFTAYSAAQEKIFYLFDEHDQTQHFLAEKYFWVVEKEIDKICSSDQPAREKRRAIQSVLRSRHLAVCIRKRPKNLSLRTRILFRGKLSLLVLLRYRLHHHNQ